LYDEQEISKSPASHYLEAIRLTRATPTPTSISLFCASESELLQAIGYWQTYLKLDSTSSWPHGAKQLTG